MTKIIRISLFIILSGFVIPRVCLALNVQHFFQAMGETTGYRVATSSVPDARSITLSADLNFVQHPLEVGITAGGKRVVGIVDQFLTLDMIANAGVSRRLGLTLDVPLNLYHNIAPIFIPSRDLGGGDFGDIRVGGKFQIVDGAHTTWPVGLSLYSVLIIPSGDASIFFGENNVAWEIGMGVDKAWGRSRVVLNVGSRVREAESIVSLRVPSEFLYGAAYHLDLGRKRNWKIIAELVGSTPWSKFFSDIVTAPLEVSVMVRKKFESHPQWDLHWGAAAGLKNGYSAPNFRFMSGLSYAFSYK